MVLEPLPGFLHLVKNPQECIDASGPYHLSICQLDIVSNIEALELEARWNDREVVLPIVEVRGEGCMYLDSCPLADDPLIIRLHERIGAWYAGRRLHISG